MNISLVSAPTWKRMLAFFVLLRRQVNDWLECKVCLVSFYLVHSLYITPDTSNFLKKSLQLNVVSN